MQKITKVNFYDSVDDALLKFAVIITMTDKKFVFCKHKERDTLEAAGGHREVGENIEDTARRELYEETGALEFSIVPICAYSVVREDDSNGEVSESFGMLYFADVTKFESDLHSEIEKIVITDKLPDNWTYPLIQPRLMEEARLRNIIKLK